MTHEEKIAWVLRIFQRDGGPYVGELVFEFMRAVHAEGFRWDNKQPSSEVDILRAIYIIDWYSTPQGFDYWDRMFLLDWGTRP